MNHQHLIPTKVSITRGVDLWHIVIVGGVPSLVLRNLVLALVS